MSLEGLTKSAVGGDFRGGRYEIHHSKAMTPCPLGRARFSRNCASAKEPLGPHTSVVAALLRARPAFTHPGLAV
jgi:hypothetical protein